MTPLHTFDCAVLDCPGCWAPKWIAFKSVGPLRITDVGVERRFGLAPGEEEYRDGVLVRRGEIMK